MKEKNKNILTWILIFIVTILLCVIAFLLGMKYANKEEQSLNETNNKETIEVVDYINKSFDKKTIDTDILEKCQASTLGVLGTHKVILPMLKNDKPGAKKLNESIQYDHEDYIQELEELHYKHFFDEYGYAAKQCGSKLVNSVFVDYEYINRNNYIFIMTDIEVSGAYTSMGGRSGFLYTYDISNDKYLDLEETLDIFNISKEDVKKSYIANNSNLEQQIDWESILDSFDFYVRVGTEKIEISARSGQLYFEPSILFDIK